MEFGTDSPMPAAQKTTPRLQSATQSENARNPKPKEESRHGTRGRPGRERIRGEFGSAKRERGSNARGNHGQRARHVHARLMNATELLRRAGRSVLAKKGQWCEAGHK